MTYSNGSLFVPQVTCVPTYINCPLLKIHVYMYTAEDRWRWRILIRFIWITKKLKTIINNNQIIINRMEYITWIVNKINVLFVTVSSERMVQVFNYHKHSRKTIFIQYENEVWGNIKVKNIHLPFDKLHLMLWGQVFTWLFQIFVTTKMYLYL